MASVPIVPLRKCSLTHSCVAHEVYCQNSYHIIVYTAYYQQYCTSYTEVLICCIYRYIPMSDTQWKTNLNRHVCKVASVDEVSSCVDVVGHTVKCSHVWITNGTTSTYWRRSVVAKHLDR